LGKITFTIIMVSAYIHKVIYTDKQ